jgi:ribose transport system permease protein
MNESAPAKKAFNPFHALNVVGPFFGLLLVLGLFALNSEVRPFLFTGGNFKIILIQTVIVAIGALGMTMIIVSGGIDLSVGSVVAFSSVLGATLLVKGYSTGATIALTVLAGGLIGLVNGLVIAGFRMMPFIVTRGMMGVVRGTAKWLAADGLVPVAARGVDCHRTGRHYCGGHAADGFRALHFCHRFE